MIRIVVYGLGQGYEKVKRYLKEEVEVVGFVDSYKEGEYLNKPLCKPENIHTLTFDYLVIASVTYEDEMYEKLLPYIPSEKIVFMNSYDRYLIKNQHLIFHELNAYERK